MALPDSLRPTWAALHDRTVFVHLNWRFHEQLFLKDKRREFLNGIAGAFFAVVQQNFLLEVQLGIARLRDDASSGKQRNLTLKLLAKQLYEVCPKPHTGLIVEFFKQFNLHLQAFEATSKHIAQRRNKYLAHSDYHYALEQQHALPSPTRTEIEASLGALSNLMNFIASHFGEATTAYVSVYADGSAENVVGMLMAGREFYTLLRDGTLDWAKHHAPIRDV